MIEQVYKHSLQTPASQADINQFSLTIYRSGRNVEFVVEAVLGHPAIFYLVYFFSAITEMKSCIVQFIIVAFSL